MFTNTAAFSGFSVDDLELVRRGVTLERYDGMGQDANGINRRTRLPRRAYRVLYRVCYSLW
jgi:hypothetical protein